MAFLLPLNKQNQWAPFQGNGMAQWYMVDGYLTDVYTTYLWFILPSSIVPNTFLYIKVSMVKQTTVVKLLWGVTLKLFLLTIENTFPNESHIYNEENNEY